MFEISSLPGIAFVNLDEFYHGLLNLNAFLKRMVFGTRIRFQLTFFPIAVPLYFSSIMNGYALDLETSRRRLEALSQVDLHI